MAFTWRRMVVGWLGLALLATQLAAVPAFPGAAAQAPGEICSVGGIRHAASPPAEDGADQAELCVFCLPLMHSGTLAQPGDTILSMPHRKAAFSRRQPAWDGPPTSKVVFSRFARGPPAT